MIADLKPYPAYKESGLPWLGQVPGHWSLERTKWRFRNRKELNASGAHTNILSLTLRGVVNNNPDDPEGLVPKDYRTYQFFAKGDLVFKLIDLENLRTSRVGLVHEDGIMSSAYVRLVPSGPGNTRYFFHQFYDLYSRGIYNQLGAGVRSTLGPSDLLSIGIVIPPPTEQAVIVRFLDWAIERLERAIQAKRRVIALLNEQKQTIIHHAVTRGRNPSVPLKPSGISWLGDIPQHWRQRALWTLSKLRIERNPNNLPLLSVFLDRGVIRYEEGGGQVHAPSLDLSNYQVVRAGDFVLNNQQAWRGSVGVSRHDGIISPAYIVLSLSDQLDSRFANYLMRSRAMVDQFVAASKGVGDIQRQVFWPFLRIVQVPLPSMEEQRAIVQHLETTTAGLTTSISRLEREIELLREYRTRLVADVVTGKLDVREAAARLPDEVAPDTAEDGTDLGTETEPADEEAAV